MLLRKHLVGARIVSLTQPAHERMLILDLDSRDELGDLTRKQLVVEMIGRSSNVILVGPDGRIIDCMRRVDFAGDALRRLLPGMLYRLPPQQDKAAFLDTPAEERRALAFAADRSVPADKWLLGRFSGLSPLLCRELSFRCGGDYELLPLQMDAAAIADIVRQRIDGVRIAAAFDHDIRQTLGLAHLAVDEGAGGIAGLVPAKHPTHGLGGATRDRPKANPLVQEGMNGLQSTLRSPVRPSGNQGVVKVGQYQLDHGESFLSSGASL